MEKDPYRLCFMVQNVMFNEPVAIFVLVSGYFLISRLKTVSFNTWSLRNSFEPYFTFPGKFVVLDTDIPNSPKGTWAPSIGLEQVLLIFINRM